MDFGCGKGFDSLKLLKSGATVYGIDIAENYIKESIELAKKNGFSGFQKTTHFTAVLAERWSKYRHD